jgi:hypothetical protein
LVFLITQNTFKNKKIFPFIKERIAFLHNPDIVHFCKQIQECPHFLADLGAAEIFPRQTKSKFVTARSIFSKNLSMDLRMFL